MRDGEVCATCAPDGDCDDSPAQPARPRSGSQIPERAIGTSVCEDAFCTLDSTAVGETVRWVAGARLHGESWRASLYGQYYDWNMISDPTYDYQINQLDRRSVFGGRFERTLVKDAKLALNAGVEGRYDDIGRVGLQHTVLGGYDSDLGRYGATESSISPYAEGTWNPVDKLRVMGGVRADFYSYDVTSRQDGFASGKKSAHILSPKAGLAYALNSKVELYGNWGRGFHSNDARGVAAPLDGNDPVAGLVRGAGKEVGTRFQHGDFTLTTTYWWLDLASELKSDGSAFFMNVWACAGASVFMNHAQPIQAGLSGLRPRLSAIRRS